VIETKELLSLFSNNLEACCSRCFHCFGTIWKLGVLAVFTVLEQSGSSVFSLFSLFWNNLEARCSRCFVYLVSKQCKTAKSVTFQMLPNSENSELPDASKIAKTVNFKMLLNSENSELPNASK